MKIKNLFLSGLICCAFTACSNNDEPGADNGLNINEGDKHFLAVTISNPNTTSGRAATDGGYESGYDNNENEGAIKTVRFYLFKGGNARNVGDDNKNYIDATVGTDPTQSDYNEDDADSGKAMATEGNLESQLSAVLVIKGEKENLPDGIIAIANPERAYLGTESKSIEELKGITGAYDIEEYTVTASESKFLMSNSVFVKDNNVQIATPIASTNYAETADGAKSNPVEIYIERVVAKVRVDFDTAEGKFSAVTNDGKTTGYRLKIEEKQSNDDVELYVNILGWGLADTRTNSNLLKSLSTAYNDFNWTWNDPTNNRSYWANTTTKDNDVQNLNYWNKTSETSLKGNFATLYCQENTASEFTKVVFAAQIEKKNGENYEPVTIYEYAGQNWTLKSLAENIGFASNVYVRTGTVDSYTYSNDISEYITFKEEDQDGDTRYKAYPVLKSNISNVTFCKKGNNGYDTYTDNAAVNTELKKIEVKVWNNGRAYYFVEIEHLGNNKGVVRNHIYDVTVNDITGFGTPVWNEELIIIPEKPQDTNTYIAARINVLSWRVVKQGVGLE